MTLSLEKNLKFKITRLKGQHAFLLQNHFLNMLKNKIVAELISFKQNQEIQTKVNSKKTERYLTKGKGCEGKPGVLGLISQGKFQNNRRLFCHVNTVS